MEFVIVELSRYDQRILRPSGKSHRKIANLVNRVQIAVSNSTTQASQFLGLHPAQKYGMTMIFGALTLLSGSLAIMISALRRAPVGYQDETGFHFAGPMPGAKGTASSADQCQGEPSRKAA